MKRVYLNKHRQSATRVETQERVKVNNQNALDECMLIAPLQKEVESRVFIPSGNFDSLTEGEISADLPEDIGCSA